MLITSGITDLFGDWMSGPVDVPQKKSRTDIIWICDCSKSMKGKRKSASMNLMIREITNELNEILNESPSTEINIRTIKFSNSAEWVNPSFVPVQSFSWNDLIPEGISNLGNAFEALSKEFQEKSPEKDQYDRYRIVLILISDGYPTDNWRAPLEDMKDLLKGHNPVYCIIRIPGISEEVVSAFAGEGPDKNHRIMTCDHIENIIQFVR
jgi:uncharacterized protein YegL